MSGRMLKFKGSIRAKLLLIVVGILIFSTVVGTALIIFNERATLDRFLIDKGRSLGTYIANISKDPILLKDNIQLDAIVGDITKDEDVVYALIQDNENAYLTTHLASFSEKSPIAKKIIAGLPQDSDTGTILTAIRKSGLAIEISHKVTIDSSDHGTVYIGLSDAKVKNQLTKTVFYVIAVNLAMALILGVILFFTMKRLIIRPIVSLCQVTEQVANGDLSRTLEVVSNDEFGHLTESLNGMIQNLNQIVTQVNAAAGELNHITEDLAGTTGKVVNAAQLQSEGVSNTSSAVIEINASIKGVAQSIDQLSLSASESSSSILEMTASVTEVAHNAETLNKSVGEVSSSIMQMTASIKRVGSSVGNLQEAATSTSSSVMQMDTSIKQVERSAAAAAAISDEVRGDAEFGRSAVEASIVGISEIKRASDITSEVINSLSERASAIGVILSVIDEVAGQTNLLALNAAIIAAQAGEHGKGFAVVADEIKELAERTSASTQEITKVISAVQNETARAVEAIHIAEKSIADGKDLSEKSGEALKKIYEGVQKATDQMREIALTTLEQSKGSQMIREAMEQVSEMVGQIAKATQEQSQGSELIMSSAEHMKQLTEQVRNSTLEQSKVANFIAQSTENITSMISTISRASGEQSRGSDQIAHAVEDIQSSASINLEATKVMDKVVTNLFMQIGVLRDQMKVFKV